jgi:Zn-finger nucleic acid-binding protein
MKCPNDNATLLITERGEVEIDYCPECRGVWLDRGELDKLIDRSVTPQPPGAVRETNEQSRPHYEEPKYRDEHYKKRRKESFLGELFDF